MNGEIAQLEKKIKQRPSSRDTKDYRAMEKRLGLKI